MRRSLRLIIGLLFLLSMLIVNPLPIEARDSISYYNPYPQGNIGVSMPEIGWKVLLKGNEVERAEFMLNGSKIATTYDQQRETFYFIPDKPLSGVNKVSAKIKLKGWSNLVESDWSFTVQYNSLSGFPLSNQNQLRAVNLANDYRYVLGLPTYTINPSLDMAAQKHAEYQHHIGEISHYQMVGEKGFFGESVLDRANYYGFYGNVAEDISSQSNPSIQEAVDSLFDAPYHRIPFLIPSYNEFGYGLMGYYHVINFGSRIDKEAQVVMYPGDGHTGVPSEWKNFETPDPLRFYRNSSTITGYPIVIGVYGKDINKVELVEANLKKSNGTQVSTYINAPSSSVQGVMADEELDQEIFIIPKSPLALGQEYSVKVTLKTITEDNVTSNITKEWSFVTEKVKNEGKTNLHNVMAYPPLSDSAELVQFRVGQDYIWVNEKGYPLDVAPFIENGRTMVPFKALGNSLGAKVSWDSATRSIYYYKDDLEIKLPLDSKVVYINGKEITVDQGAVIKNARSFVPSRLISEQLGAEVDWIPAEQGVFITK